MRCGTYSIVARDPASGELGAAVQSHWFGVGAIVPWARPGVGAVATQSIAEVAYGPRALDQLAEGASAHQALAALVAGDELAPVRQVAVVDAAGEVAVHTGEGCIAHAGHVRGAGFSCQANMMAGETVPAAMAAAFGASSGPLAERLVDALYAAEGAGGDVRGRQSAALVVVPAAGEPWRTLVELRVEDDPEPLAELRRLLRVHRAYELADEGDRFAGEGRPDEAGECYRRASELAPDNIELSFWAGLSLAQSGDLEGAVARVRAAFDAHPGWAELLDRLTPEIAPGAEAVRRALGR